MMHCILLRHMWVLDLDMEIFILCGHRAQCTFKKATRLVGGMKLQGWK